MHSPEEMPLPGHSGGIKWWSRREAREGKFGSKNRRRALGH